MACGCQSNVTLKNEVFISQISFTKNRIKRCWKCFFFLNWCPYYKSTCCAFWRPHGGDVCEDEASWGCTAQKTRRVLLCHKRNNPLGPKAWCLSRWSPGCRRKAGCTWLSSFCWWQSEETNNNMTRHCWRCTLKKLEMFLLIMSGNASSVLH